MWTMASIIMSTSIFNQKSALVFGGANGIGQAIAIEFARRGAKVAVADIAETAALETAARIQEDGGQAVALACDVTSIESVTEVAQLALAELAVSEIDIVVNNVGVIVSGHPQDIPLAEWQRILNLNLFSIINSNDVFLPLMLARGSGHIVNTASFAGLYPYAPNRMPYSASKAAVVSLSESLAIYLEPKGIRVSCFCPGPVATAVTKSMKSWSEDAVMIGPGSQFELMTAEQAALVLADGMQQNRIFIPTHDSVLEEMQDHAADPDAYIRRKAKAIAAGDLGLPKLPH